MKHEISIGKKKPTPSPPPPGITIQNRIPREAAEWVIFLFANPFSGNINDAFWSHVFRVLWTLVQGGKVYLYEKNLSTSPTDTTYDLFWIRYFNLWQEPVYGTQHDKINVWEVPTLLAVNAKNFDQYVMMSGRRLVVQGIDDWASEVLKMMAPPVLPDGIAPPPTTTNQVAPPREDYTPPPPPAPAATTSLLDNKTLLFTGIAVVAVLLLKGKKGKKTAVSGTGKRRGRPRKNAQVGEAAAQVAATETVQELTAETTAKDAVSGTPKRRGRPKKAVTVGEVETPSTVTGKRRGRPRKAEKVGEVAPQVAAPESATVAGKRRGRPRKAAQVAETPPAGAPSS